MRTPITYLGYLAPFGDLEIVPTVLPAPTHREAKALYEYWRRLESRGGLKLGRDIPARRIARLMSKLAVLEPSLTGDDFIFRLVGSGWLTRFGRDVKGEALSQIYSGENLAHYLTGLRAVLVSGFPNFVDVRTKDKAGERHHIEYAEFPVCDTNSDSRLVLIGAFHI